MLYTTDGFADDEPRSCFWALLCVVLITFAGLGMVHYAAHRDGPEQPITCEVAR